MSDANTPSNGWTPPPNAPDNRVGVVRRTWQRFRRLPVWVQVVTGVVLLGIIVAMGASGAGDETKKASSATTRAADRSSSPPTKPSTSVERTTTTAATTTTLPPTTTTTLPGFDDGTWVVPTEIAPGTYEVDAGSGCYWARLKDASGSLESISANDNTSGHTIVAVLPTDAAFESNDCGRWSIYTPEPAPLTAFDDGTWAVNRDIAPGRYRSTGGSACYWQRSSSFSGDIGTILANDNVDTGSALVDVQPSDVEFKSSDCGHWQKVG
jgi:hypothetical protein